mgnify:CR=1 FL=1
MVQIREVISELNPWWKGKISTQYKDREIYYEIQKFMKLPQIIALVGLRRVGKTTLILKIIEDMIKRGFSSKNIIYFSFDEFKDIEIREVIKVYEEVMEIDIKEGKYLFCFDEIQKLHDWENQLKAVYDVHHKNIKIIISGSESLFIRKKSKETLAGRIFEFNVDPLSFREFLNFRGLSFEPRGLYEKELLKTLNEFILSQGFPELAGVREFDVIKKYITESVIEKVVYKDIPTLFAVKDISVIKILFDVLMEEPGQLIEISKLSKELGMSRQTISQYLFYLEQTFLIRKLYNFSRNKRKIERKLKKYYPAFVSPNLLFKEDTYFKSKVFEWLIVNQLKAEFFWRDSYKNEVDIVLINKKFEPLEIKYGDIETKGIISFMEKFNVKEGKIISLKKEDILKINNKVIRIIPAFKFLLEKKRLEA